jgi:hypothetical protein
MGKPDRDNRLLYTRIEISGVVIWKSPAVEVDNVRDSIRIGLSRFFFFKRLSIDGASISNGENNGKIPHKNSQ